MNTPVDWTWLARNRELIVDKLVEHVQLTVLATLLALGVAILLALTARRVTALRTPLLALTGVLYTIPSLALFVLLLTVWGLSRTTAVVGLALYALLILLRNILVGLEQVPAEVREAAAAMGHSRRQLLWRVEVPLALPAIVAGLRLATVSTIGLVAVTAMIGHGGVGRLFLIGLQRRNATALLTGFVLSILLAVLAELCLGALERRLTPWVRRRDAAGAS